LGKTAAGETRQAAASPAEKFSAVTASFFHLSPSVRALLNEIAFLKLELQTSTRSSRSMWL
jgi:hypothetical protein